MRLETLRHCLPVAYGDSLLNLILTKVRIVLSDYKLVVYLTCNAGIMNYIRSVTLINLIVFIPFLYVISTYTRKHWPIFYMIEVNLQGFGAEIQ